MILLSKLIRVEIGRLQIDIVNGKWFALTLPEEASPQICTSGD